MVSELPAVVSRDRAYRPKAAFTHESFDGCDDFVLRDRLDLLDERVAGLALREDEQPAFPASRGDDGIHFPVSKPCSLVHCLRSKFDGKSARIPV